MSDRVILTIGTKKGVFVADAAKPRGSFALRGPFGPGVPVYSKTSISPDASTPWGGVPVTFGSMPWGPSGAPPPPPADQDPCPSPDPCVLTGQSNRHRDSTNALAYNLAGMTTSSSFSNFGLAYLYPVTNVPSGYASEPVIAQPLYITNINVPNAATSMCGGTKYCNMLVVATLSGFVYAFDTSTAPTASGGNALWNPINLPTAAGHCGTGGVPYFNTNNFMPGAANLPYYGIVATPVIDNGSQKPTLFVVSACATSRTSTTLSWYMDAIDLTTGGIRETTPAGITDTNFYASNQLARSSLLVTHPGGGSTYVYTAFAAGVREIGAENDTTTNTTTKRYSGVVFAFPYTYPSTFGTALTPFYTSCMNADTSTCPTNVFPSVYAVADANGYLQGGAAGPGTTGYCSGIPTSGPSNCSPGFNWAVNQAGIWMSSRGLASSNVFFAAGNGPFACTSTDSGQTGCTTTTAVKYWGESVMQFPNALATSPTTPQDFFAPNKERYTCPPSTPGTCNTQPNCLGYNLYQADCYAAPYQTEELSKTDQDLGVGGTVIIPQANGANFAMTSDKSGYVYVMPPATGEKSNSSLGQFQQNDVGLIGGSSPSYITQTPFQASRHPQLGDTSYCISVNQFGKVSGAPCDEVHELAYNNDLLLVWPSNETVELFQGSYLAGPPIKYSFAATADPCNTTGNCTGQYPPFPTSNSTSAGGAMAIAAHNAAPQTATLWAIVPQSNSGGASDWGTLYAYNIDSTPSLGTGLWNSFNPSGPHKCTSSPASGWFTTAFTEPTLADNKQSSTLYGAVYVPTTCVQTNTDGTQYPSCAAAATAGHVKSGVLVFTNCP